MTRHHDQGNIEKEVFTGGLTASEGKSESIMAGSVVHGRHTAGTRQVDMALEQLLRDCTLRHIYQAEG